MFGPFFVLLLLEGLGGCRSVFPCSGHMSLGAALRAAGGSNPTVLTVWNVSVTGLGCCHITFCLSAPVLLFGRWIKATCGELISKGHVCVLFWFLFLFLFLFILYCYYLLIYYYYISTFASFF